MLGVILFILKTIGILLLAVIGILLLVLLIILFIPVRYRIKLEHGEELLILDSKLSWLFHIVRARVSHMNGVFHILVKVLWFTIYDNLQPRKQKVKKSKKTARRKTAKKAVKKSKIPTGKKETIKTEQNIENRESSDISGGKRDTISEKTVNRIKETIHSDKIELKKAAENQLQAKEHDIDTAYKIEQNEFENKNENQNGNQNKIEEQKEIEDPHNVQKQHKIEDQYTIDEQHKGQVQQIQEQDVIEEQADTRAKAMLGKTQVKKEKASFFKRSYDKIKEMKEKVTAFIHNLIEKIKIILESAHNIKGKLDLILGFIQLDANKEGFKITWKSLKKIIKHLLPTELSSKIKFGTGDPCSTGQALGVLGMLYSLYGDKIQITPDFENKVLEGKHFARGRIRLVTILIIVIKLILDKRFKKLTKNIVVLKEAL